jgi:hypothetical protein
MKRRGFFGALFGIAVAPAPATIAVASTPAKEEDGVMWQPKCGVCKKIAPVEIFVSLEKPVGGMGTQCPFCLAVYDTTGLGQLIRDYNLAKGRNL